MSAEWPITAVVFDWGGVLTEPPLAGLEAYGDVLGVPPGTMSAFVRGDEEFAKVERGELTAREFLKDVCRRVAADHTGVEVDIHRLADAMTASRKLEPDMIDLVRRLADSYDLGVLSNNVRENQNWLDSTLPTECFRVILNSADLGLRKPDPKIYEELVRQLDRDPREIVYVDDFEENLPPAEALGMRTIHFQNPESLQARLATLGLRAAPGI